MIARWTGRVAAGKTGDQPWAFWDFLPTAAELAGVPAPAGIDGMSIVPALAGKPLAKREYLYWETNRSQFLQAVRMGDWKAVRHHRDARIELFHLARDPGEKTDVVAANPQVVAKAAELFRTARADNPDYPIDKPVRKSKPSA